MEIKAIKTGIFKENEDLLQFILKYVKKIPENSVLVVASKIVALSEGRFSNDISENNKERLIRKESSVAIKTKYTWLTVKNNTMLASAGIDESNANGKLILLPKNSFISAQKIRSLLHTHFKIKNLGIIISDSGLLPFRNGVIGLALGYAGLKGVKSYKGKKDIFSRKFVYQKTNIADSLATAAALCMGEGNERKPLAVIINAPVVFTNKTDKKEITISPKEDIFYPLLKNIKKLSNAKK